VTKLRLTSKYEKSARKKVELRKRKILNFEPDRLAFNFSFITRDRKYGFDGKGFTKVVKGQMFDKMVRLSSERYNAILGWPKRLGLENLPEKEVAVAVHPDFTRSLRHLDCLPGFWIFRISDTGRIIGRIQEKTFYILAVDTKFKLYKH